MFLALDKMKRTKYFSYYENTIFSVMYPNITHCKRGIPEVLKLRGGNTWIMLGTTVIRTNFLVKLTKTNASPRNPNYFLGPIEFGLRGVYCITLFIVPLSLTFQGSSSQKGVCFNMVLGMHYQILYSKVGMLYNPQNKIIGVMRRFEQPQELRFSVSSFYSPERKIDDHFVGNVSIAFLLNTVSQSPIFRLTASSDPKMRSSCLLAFFYLFLLLLDRLILKLHVRIPDIGPHNFSVFDFPISGHMTQK